jgi:uncharacterized membrane protein HdeD (DUF308 family)
MNRGPVDLDSSALAPRWWTFVLRGIAAILFGVITFALPGISALALVLLWGTYAVANGVLGTVLAAAGAARGGGRWGWLLFEGVVSIVAGVVAFAWPRMTALVLLTLIGFWAFFVGIAQIVAASELRRVLKGEWRLALSGALSIAFSLLILVFPRAGALAVVTLIGTYAIFFGTLLTALGIRLHGLGGSGRRSVPRDSPSHA